MGTPFQELNVSLLYPVQNQFWCMLRIIVLLEDPTVSNFQPSSYWSEAKLKNSQVVLPLHYSIDFVQYTITTCGRRAPKHDATTSILHSWYGVLRFKSLHTWRTYLLGLWFNLYLTIQLFKRKHLICVDFGAGAYFLVGTLLIHGNVKLTSLWTP